MGKDRPPVNIWKDIERCSVARLDIVFEGSTIVGIHHSDITDVTVEIDWYCKKLQEYKYELSLYYGTEYELKKKSRFYTYIYLLRNNRNNLYKIGRSIKPEFREKTIQSEEPEVEMLFISPITAPEKEKELHSIFKNKRVRGEWFDLDNKDIKLIKGYCYGS